MKVLAVILIVAMAGQAYATTDEAIPLIVLDIIDGLFDGFGLESGLIDIVNCTDDADKVLYDIYEAIAEIMSKDTGKIMKALTKLGDAFLELFDALKYCDSLPADIKKLIAVFEQFKNPWQYIVHVGKDLVVNGVEIFGEVMSAITSWKKEDYNAFGQNIGKALYEIFIGK